MAYIFAVILFPVIFRPIVYAGFINSLHRGGGANTRQETKLKTGGGQMAATGFLLPAQLLRRAGFFFQLL